MAMPEAPSWCYMQPEMEPLEIARYTMVSAMGRGADASLDAFRARRGGLRQCDFEDADLETWVGRIEGIEETTLPESLASFDCRNNRLAWLTLQQDGFADAVADASGRFGAKRIGVFVGTSTSGIRETEIAYCARDPKTGALPRSYRYRQTHNTFSAADFTRQALALQGPAQAVSTACSSSAKAFAIGHRHIAAGLCDAAVVGGIDSLCLTTLYGFNALGLLSPLPCRPWDVERNGISIGEAAAFALLTRPTDRPGAIALLGVGESMDAYHLSTPHPDGLGATIAMDGALESAGLDASDIGYINLHGTATPANDAAEDRAVTGLFGTETPCSSTKGWTGHTLGASGIVEALIACQAIEHGLVPGSLNTQSLDPALSAAVQIENLEHAPRYAMSNSFGFGGNNCSLVMGRLDS